MHRRRPWSAALVAALLAGAAAPAAWAHGGEFYRPPPPEKKLKRPPGTAETGGGGAATTPDEPPGPTTGGSASKFGPDDWRAWWETQRAAYAVARTADAETPGGTSAAPAAPTERDAAVASLRRAVDDADEDLATAALVALGRVGDRASESKLIAVLLDPLRRQPVREAAACGLALLGPARSDPGTARLALEQVAMGAQGEARLRSIAVYSLGLRAERESLDVLGGLAVARRTDRQVSCAAASALGLLGAPEALPVLQTLLERGRADDDDPVPVRVYAAQGLARTGDGGAVAALRSAAADPEPSVRRAAALALGSLAGSGDDETQRVLRRMADQDRDVRCRDVALVSLGRQGHATSRRLLDDAIRGGRQVHPTYALTALALWARRNGDAAAALAVRSRLDAANDPGLRAAACFATAAARDRDAAPVVLRIAEGRNDPFLRAVAISSVPALAHREDAAPLLLRLLDAAEPPEIRREAATALGVLRDSAAAPALSDLVEKAERLYVRAAATVALGRVGGPGASARLRKLVDEPGREGMLRALAAVGLGLLLERPDARPLHLVCDDLDWDHMTDAVVELMSVL